MRSGIAKLPLHERNVKKNLARLEGRYFKKTGAFEASDLLSDAIFSNLDIQQIAFLQQLPRHFDMFCCLTRNVF